MKLKDYGDELCAGKVLQESPDVPVDPPFRDERGAITNVWLSGCQSVAVITSKARTIRANHVHTTDWHVAHVVTGRVWYYWRDGHGTLHRRVYEAGDSFYSGPGEPHAMAFPVDTTFITVARNVRDHETHESDLVRTVVIDDSVFDAEEARQTGVVQARYNDAAAMERLSSVINPSWFRRLTSSVTGTVRRLAGRS